MKDEVSFIAPALQHSALTMTNDERISSYIDNEFSPEQEQEFLISLAASDGLRKSFRSELVLKKVVHTDEMLTNPPREMRAAVFAAIGLGTAAAVTASKANAGQATATASHGLLKSIFATKMGTLITAAGLSVSAIAGYGVHSLVNPTPTTVETPRTMTSQRQVVSPSQVQTIVPAQTASKTESLGVAHVVKHHHARLAAKAVDTKVSSPVESTPNGVAGGGSVEVKPPTITKTK